MLNVFTAIKKPSGQMCEDEVHTKEAIDEKIRVVRFLLSILEEEKTTFQRKQNNKVFEM